jgi:ribose 1,5-bisphosphokinase PhnN
MRLDDLRAIRAVDPARLARPVTAVALVGPSGSGKTTLVGAVRVAGIPNVEVPVRYVTRPARGGDVASETVHVSDDDFARRVRDGAIAIYWRRPLESGRVVRYGFAPVRAEVFAVYSANSAILTAGARLEPPGALADALIVGVHAPSEICAARLRERSPDLAANELAFRLAHDRDPIVDVAIENHVELERVAPIEIVTLIRRLAGQVR